MSWKNVCHEKCNIIYIYGRICGEDWRVNNIYHEKNVYHEKCHENKKTCHEKMCVTLHDTSSL